MPGQWGHDRLAQTQITRDMFYDLGSGLNERDHERDLGAAAKQRVYSVIFLVHSVIFVCKYYSL